MPKAGKKRWDWGGGGEDGGNGCEWKGGEENFPIRVVKKFSLPGPPDPRILLKERSLNYEKGGGQIEKQHGGNTFFNV